MSRKDTTTQLPKMNKEENTEITFKGSSAKIR
jgi:hypothetical protein